MMDMLCKDGYHLQTGSQDQETTDSGAAHSLLAVPDQILDTCDNNYLCSMKQGQTQTSTGPHKIKNAFTKIKQDETTNDLDKTCNDLDRTCLDLDKTSNYTEKTSNYLDDASNDLDKTSNDLDDASNDLDDASNDLDKTSYGPDNRNTTLDRTKISSGKKFKTVVVKHFNVKTVSPGASR